MKDSPDKNQETAQHQELRGFCRWIYLFIAGRTNASSRSRSSNL